MKVILIYITILEMHIERTIDSYQHALENYQNAMKK